MLNYPKPIRVLNEKFSIFSGAIILIIGCLAVFEVIMRGVFATPTTWSADFSQYLLIYAIFFAAGYGFQAKGHVRVDILTRMLPMPIQRALSVIAYLFTTAFVLMFTYNAWNVFLRTFEANTVTLAVITIPRWILMIAMLIGCVLMIVTLVSILYSLFKKQDDFM